MLVSADVHLQILYLYHFFSCRITSKVPLAKGKETSTSNDKEIHDDNDSDKKTS